jgi:hypothetical protein
MWAKLRLGPPLWLSAGLLTGEESKPAWGVAGLSGIKLCLHTQEKMR